MWIQEYERIEFLQIIADIIALILGILKPYVTPIGAWMVSWVDVLLTYFPTDSLVPYYTIFAILVISGIIINTKWPGEKYIGVYTKEESERDIEGKDSNIDFHDND